MGLARDLRNDTNEFLSEVEISYSQWFDIVTQLRSMVNKIRNEDPNKLGLEYNQLNEQLSEAAIQFSAMVINGFMSGGALRNSIKLAARDQQIQVIHKPLPKKD